MDEFDRLYGELEKEYPALARLYNDFHAGDVPAERLRWNYERGNGYTNLIDEAKNKYLLILQDMGLLLTE